MIFNLIFFVLNTHCTYSWDKRGQDREVKKRHRNKKFSFSKYLTSSSILKDTPNYIYDVSKQTKIEYRHNFKDNSCQSWKIVLGKCLER